MLNSDRTGINAASICYSLLCYDHTRSLGLVGDRGRGILVDMDLCNTPDGDSQWARQPKGQVMVMGYLERAPHALEMPPRSLYVDVPESDPTLVLRAIWVRTAEHMDINLWREGVSAMQEPASASERPPECPNT